MYLFIYICANVYLAHLYSFWERATNENTNGLIRQFFSKKCYLAKVIGQKNNECCMEKLNTRPNKCLGFKSPDL